MSSVVTARRTTIRPGRELDYTRIHAVLPVAVESALRETGVIRWRIWRDGATLFHEIETRDGYQAMIEAIIARGPLDTEWDALIDSLLDSSPGCDVFLPLVWGMDAHGQWPGDQTRTQATPP